MERITWHLLLSLYFSSKDHAPGDQIIIACLTAFSSSFAQLRVCWWLRRPVVRQLCLDGQYNWPHEHSFARRRCRIRRAHVRADLQALQLAGGLAAPIAILPTAAAPDHNDERAGRNGWRWFPPWAPQAWMSCRSSTRPQPKTPRWQPASARHAYLYPGRLPRLSRRTLSGSCAWQACLDTYAGGAVLAGSSAGAMVLCQYVYDPEQGQTMPGLNLISNACVLPHHNTFGRGWAPRLQKALPHVLLIGIDEQTGMLGDQAGSWTVWGAGEAIPTGAPRRNITPPACLRWRAIHSFCPAFRPQAASDPPAGITDHGTLLPIVFCPIMLYKGLPWHLSSGSMRCRF